MGLGPGPPTGGRPASLITNLAETCLLLGLGRTYELPAEDVPPWGRWPGSRRARGRAARGVCKAAAGPALGRTQGRRLGGSWRMVIAGSLRARLCLPDVPCKVTSAFTSTRTSLQIYLRPRCPFHGFCITGEDTESQRSKVFKAAKGVAGWVQGGFSVSTAGVPSGP